MNYRSYRLVVISWNYTNIRRSYRLGTFGFLYSSALDQERTIAKEGTINDAFRGNFGLHDQRLALEWVHRNIEGFGGDVSRRVFVTIQFCLTLI